MRACFAVRAASSPVPTLARGGSASSGSLWHRGHGGFTPVALKPIGRSPAYYTPNRPKAGEAPDEPKRRTSPIARLFGGGGELKAEVAKLEYELECSRTQASELGLELRDAKTALAKVEESHDLYKERCTLQEKEIFALERQNEETKKGFDTGMAVAKRQIKMLEEMLDEAKKSQ